jgi:hypothetical protein
MIAPAIGIVCPDNPTAGAGFPFRVSPEEIDARVRLLPA